jgi:hypothetical protein
MSPLSWSSCDHHVRQCAHRVWVNLGQVFHYLRAEAEGTAILIIIGVAAGGTFDER